VQGKIIWIDLEKQMAQIFPSFNVEDRGRAEGYVLFH